MGAIRKRARVAAVGRPPEADQRAVREAILRAALRLFGEQGFDACSLQEIAARAGVTKPMVYYYYESKAGLLRAVIDGVLAEMFGRLRTIAADDTRSVRERVELLVREHHEGMEKQPEVTRFIRRLFFTDPPRGLCPFDRKQMKQMLGAIYQAFRTMAEQGLRAGELRGEAPILATLLHATFAYAPMIELLFEDEPRARRGRWIEEMFASLWTGLAPARGEESQR